MNKVNLTGRWTKDLELTFLPGNGTAVAKGILAVNKKFKKEGQPQADFLPIVIWRKQAESTSNYCGKKGDLIGISGRIETRNYTNKEGNTVYITEIVAEETDFLNFKSNNNIGNVDNNQVEDNGKDITPVDEGDIPF